MKLFGRTISLTCNTDVSTNDSSSFPREDFSHHSPYSSSSSPLEVNSSTEHETKRHKEPSRKELTSDDEASQQTTEDSKSHTSSCLIENPRTPSSETETSQQNGEKSDMSQDKSLTKPDKIQPCPRCSSKDTKFCYYNNYNVKQPRHFCKNCQRYWTAGGIMRNMPVGAGRRKNKISHFSSADSNYRQVIPQSTAVLTFGSDSNMSSTSHEEKVNKCYQNFPPQFPFQNHPWNPSMIPHAAFYQQSYPVSFYPNIAYYGGFLPQSWSVQSISSQSCEPNSPTLGKHSRDGEILFHSNSKKEKLGSESNNNSNSVLIPKTLRIDEPDEAAKSSSTWSKLGIKAFASKGGDKNHVVETSSILQANPAALSRSLVFHERI